MALANAEAPLFPAGMEKSGFLPGFVNTLGHSAVYLLYRRSSAVSFWYLFFNDRRKTHRAFPQARAGVALTGGDWPWGEPVISDVTRLHLIDTSERGRSRFPRP